MIRGLLAVWLLTSVHAVVVAAEPVFRETEGEPASDEVVATILEANDFWLHPPV